MFCQGRRPVSPEIPRTPSRVLRLERKLPRPASVWMLATAAWVTLHTGHHPSPHHLLLRVSSHPFFQFLPTSTSMPTFPGTAEQPILLWSLPTHRQSLGCIPTSDSVIPEAAPCFSGSWIFFLLSSLLSSEEPFISFLGGRTRKLGHTDGPEEGSSV